MVVPLDTTVTLEIVAQDVAHSWWIPKLGGKFDAIPGYTNYTWFKIPSSKWKSGTVFTGNCAELCGRGHANMTGSVKAVTPGEYERFIEQRKRDIRAANEAAARQRRDERARTAGAGRPADGALGPEPLVRAGRLPTNGHEHRPSRHQPSPRSSSSPWCPSPAAGPAGSRRPTTSGSGSCTWS